MESNSSAKEINDTENNLNESDSENSDEGSELFTLPNILLLIGILLCGFLAVVILSKLFS